MELKHLDTQTQDGAQLNLDALYQICPSAFTEVKSEEGKVKRAVNWTTLRELLGDDAVEQADEMYQFTWPGKQQARREAARPIDKTLRPVPEDSVDWDTTQNLYIEGDNLEVLKLLQKSYLGKVKMIYIDPPYNTGNDFVYDDDFAMSSEEYAIASGQVETANNYTTNNYTTIKLRRNTDSNGRFHSDWCSMIYARLLVARSLLTEDGVIFISIDDNEVENLRKICDEVFGEGNFVANIVWEKRYTRSNNAKKFTTLTEPVICYSKNSFCIENIKEPRNEKADSIYSNPDNDPRGVWTSVSYVNPATKDQRPNLVYPLINPFTKQEVTHPTNAWKYEKSNYERHIAENRLYWGKNGENTYPRLKKFLSEMDGGMVPVDLWKHEDTGSTDAASKELEELLGRRIFDFPKPKELMMRMLKLIINGKEDKDFIILDFFSGSATTAHAVMQLNAEDGGNRRFIMVQLPEETAEDSEARKAGYKNICEIGKERIRRAGKKIREEVVSKELLVVSKDKDLFDNQLTTNNQQLTTTTLDTGFRVFRIDESNFTNVNRAPGEYRQDQLDLFLDNVKPDRNDLDLLFGAMLSWGVELSLPLEVQEVVSSELLVVSDELLVVSDELLVVSETAPEEVVSDELLVVSETAPDKLTTTQLTTNNYTTNNYTTKIYIVNDGDLVACFSENVSEAVIKAMADKQPLRVLFRDSCFTQDDQKINLFEQFKQHLDWSEEEALSRIRVV